ncbi:putative trehalose-phosphatase [Helianthus annuus]|nr:putative trehalose-phosphatase [Helianthus annuus]KAJ0557671.1 putative trehalose-phosphatase [Helianthus annuus]KAJ0590435.1 putative trehalose-phosphatase [Helianthus annuus]KAJ0837258.1 putative trehalose-phosphatase [Helianthus annuus]KAJ0876780.1 putative trehalose-phosphatase [Helianthus annuus]
MNTNRKFCSVSVHEHIYFLTKQTLGLSSCKDVLPIYVGDDKTDEDAFKFLTEGNRGYGILVTPAPKESSAYYSLRDPSEVCVCFITFIA